VLTTTGAGRSRGSAGARRGPRRRRATHVARQRAERVLDEAVRAPNSSIHAAADVIPLAYADRMITGEVAERTFLHLSNWTNPFDSGTLDTTKAWEQSQYWTTRVATDEWCGAAEAPDGSWKLDSIVFAKGHPVIALMRRLKYAAELAKELVFEDVRRTEFAERPSRRSCMFLLDESVDPESYAKAMWGSMGTRALYRVELVSGRVHRGTLSALNCNMKLHPDIVQNARSFWTHAEPSLDTEILFEGVCKLTRMK
jgi:hypothetical protein